MTQSLTSALNSSAAVSPLTRLPDIAFTGKMGAGKTTAAEMLVERFGYTRLRFAQGVRDVARLIWGEEDGERREYLQGIGVAVRGVDENAWVKRLMLALKECPPDHPVVIDDCRFPNEYWTLKAEGFVIVQVIAERNKRVDRLRANGRMQSEDQLDHVSETAIDHLASDYRLFNQGTEDDLKIQVYDLIAKEAKRS